jgi:hypothetical protein
MMMAVAVLAGSMVAAQAMAQQVVSGPVVQPAPARARATQPTQPTRQYRSYSVNPARSDVRRDGPHGGEASWRHAGAKAVGHYSGGR